jgi:hypothetical protein
MDIKETKELIQALGKLGVAGKKIASDKKIGIDDITHIVDLASQANDILEGFKGLAVMLEELKDLDQTEVIEIVGELYKQAEAINKA